MLLGQNIVVTGGSGFLGGHVVQSLILGGASPDRIFVPRKSSYDLTDAEACARMYRDFRPDVVINLAAEVGGIKANRNSPGRFFFSNISMGINLIEQARIFGLDKFVQVGTVCSYPKHCPVPFSEDRIWDGFPEETNAPYGIAKKALMVMLDAYRVQYGMKSSILIPCNLYGPGDNFDAESGHVIPGMIRRFLQASSSKEDFVQCWGTGRATREFLYVKDAADAVVKAVFSDEFLPMNIGGGLEISTSSLAAIIADLCGYNGEIRWDSSMPDGQPRRLVDSSRARVFLGWKPSTSLEEGLRRTIDWFRR